jgi:hypothetical protein
MAWCRLWAAGVRHRVLLTEIRDHKLDDALVQRMVVGVVELKLSPDADREVGSE